MPSFSRMSWVCSVSLNYSSEIPGKFLYLLQHRTSASPLPPRAMLHVVSIVTQHSAVLTGPQVDSSEQPCRCQPQPTLKRGGVWRKEAKRETKYTKRELGRQCPLSIPVRDSIISGSWLSLWLPNSNLQGRQCYGLNVPTKTCIGIDWQFCCMEWWGLWAAIRLRWMDHHHV